MKSQYVSPKAVKLPIESAAFLATSGNDDDDSVQCNINNTRPTDDSDDNFFSNQRGAVNFWE